MLTRRQFVIGAATVLASATGCTLRPKGPEPVVEAPAVPIPAAPEPDRPIRIALLSDTHVQDPASNIASAVNGKVIRAVADFKPFKPDLWICNGDVSDHGLPGEFEAFKKILAAAAKPEQLLVTTGNHEFYDMDASDDVALSRFMKAFGLQQPYSNKVVGGLHFVMLADEQWHSAPRNREWAWLTAEQLAWFEQVLQEHSQLFTVVCLHQPLQDTVVWSHGGNDFGGCGQAAELRAIIKKHPQIRLWLSGHTHHRLETPNQVSRQGGVTFACLGSTFYQFIPSEAPEARDYGGFLKDLSVSQSRLLEIWPDKVVLRARDHIAQAWMEDLELTWPLG